MGDAPTNPGQPARRRFAPIPIETTFERYRKGGPQPAPAVPVGEPTPSPSPQSASPPRTLWTQEPSRERPKEKEKRRFAPQLIESSRRSRRTGDIGPATKPTDKTDITPYHNHIYAPKTRKKHRKVQSLARRESCDEDTAAHVFEMLAREAEKRLLEEAALAAFPNSRARAGGAEHFAIREGSEDDDSTGTRSRDLTGPRIPGVTRRSRRDSHTEDVGWALREMQEHHEQLSKVRAASVASGSPYIPAGVSTTASATAVGTPDGAAISLPRPIQLDRISTLDLDRMSMESPPSDPIWTTTARQSTQDSAIHPIGETFMPYIPEEPLSLPSAGDGYKGIPSYARQLRETEGDIDEEDEADLLRQSATPSVHPIGETAMPYIPAAPEGKAADMPYNGVGAGITSQIPAETGFRGRNAYAGYRNRDLFASERDVNRLRKKSPPMLGKDLVFPKCLSPKQTKLEPEFLWNINDDYQDESHQDSTGQHGLWHGLCFSRDKKHSMVPIERPAMLATPFPPSSPGDPFAHGASLSDPGTVYAELSRMNGASRADGASSGSATAHAMSTNGGGGLGLPHSIASRLHVGGGAGHAEPKGLHMLVGLDERLRQEKAAAELEEKIAAEFTDRFVTQVYNYLSLGYPAMARSYDDELSKISRISVDDLEQDDDSAMDGIASAKGHISLDDDDDVDRVSGGGANDGRPSAASAAATSYNHDSCPRWRALKLYIYEWARQHPDLDSISPHAWGVRERRGSWGI